MRRLQPRSIVDLSCNEWDDLLTDFADVLDRYDVSGSVAGIYDLYTALQDERSRGRGNYLRKLLARPALVEGGPDPKGGGAVPKGAGPRARKGGAGA